MGADRVRCVAYAAGFSGCATNVICCLSGATFGVTCSRQLLFRRGLEGWRAGISSARTCAWFGSLGGSSVRVTSNTASRL